MECGGAQRVVADMANYWAQCGWRISLITLTGESVPDFYELHPTIHRIYLNQMGVRKGYLQKIFSNLITLYKLRCNLAAGRIDVVISFMDVINVLTLLASFGLPPRIVISERTDLTTSPEVLLVWRFLRRCVYSWADVIVGQTLTARRLLELHYPGRTAVIPNSLRPLPLPDCRRQSTILSVGRLVHSKGFDVLFDAFAQIKDRCPDWSLIILGEGPERGSLLDRARALGIYDRLSMPGSVIDPERWMAEAGIAVQASRYEGFPNVVLEAMAMGAAVISSDCPSGPADLIQDGINGRLFAVDDTSGLADAMIALISDADMRNRMGSAAMYVRASFAQHEVMSRWEQVLAFNHSDNS
ncbi:RfaG Glycosyltransferase [Burkholderiaceae bacterium]